MDRAALLEKTRKELRSLLISAPRGVPARMLYNDYKAVIGKELPFRQLGFRTLEEFVRAQSDVVKLGVGPTGEQTYFGMANAETAQILRFVSSQKKPKLKKSLAPPPAVARTPVRVAAFTKKSRYGPRPYSRGGTNNRVGRPVKRSFSQSSYNPYTQPSRPNFPPRYPPAQREVYRPDTSSSHSSGSPQSLIIRALNPSFHQSSSLQDHRPPPRQRLGSLPIDLNSPSAEVSGIPPWRKEFERVPEVTIRQLHDRKDEIDFNKTVCITGFSSGKHLEENKDGVVVLKFLLFSQYKSGKPQLPAVMLYFRPKFWDLKEYPDPLHLGEGAKLKVYGGPFIQYSKKKNVGEPACTVMYYERLSPAVRSASSSANNSAPASPLGSLPKPTGSPGRPQSLDMLKSGSLEDKVYKLLQSKPQGVYGKRLGKELEAMFHQVAPPDVLHRAKIMPFVKWEEIVPGVCILYPKPGYYPVENGEDVPPHPEQQTKPSLRTPEAVSPCSPSQSVPKQSATSAGQERPVPSSQSTRTSHTPQSPRSAAVTPSSQPVAPSPPLLPNTAEFSPDLELFDVYVCHINSPISFYIQLNGKDTSERFQAMEEGLNKHFSNRAEPACVVSVDRLYGYCWEGEEEGEDFQWCRALVVAMENNEASVMFPDYGNSETVKCKDLRQLPDRFYTVPFQAIHCCLHGITESEEEAGEKFSELAADKTCVANVMDRSGSRVAVELIVSESECQETVNSILMKDFHPISTLTPNLPSPGSPLVPVKLTDVDEDGVVSLQLIGPGLNCLQQLMNEINNAYSKLKAKASDFVKNVTEGTVYCAKFSVDGNWYRVMVKKILQTKGKVLVEYIDYGNEEQLDRLRLRKALDIDLFSLPCQVVKCHLWGLPPPQGKWTEYAMGAVAEYVESEDLQLEVVESASDGCPASVKLFVKCEEEIVSLHELLLAQPGLFGLQETGTCIEEEEEDFAYAGVDTSSVSSHSSRVSDGVPEEPPSSPEQAGGGPMLATKQPGKKVVEEKMDIRDVQEGVGQLSLLDGEKGLLGNQEEGGRTHNDASVTAPLTKYKVMSDHHMLPVDVTRMDAAASRTTPKISSSSISISNVPEVLLDISNVNVSIQPITPATSTSSLHPCTPIGSPSLPITPATSTSSLHPCTPIGSPSPPISTKANQSGDIAYNHLEPYTPVNSSSPSISPRHHVDMALGSDMSTGGGEMKFESLTPLKPVPVIVSWAASPGDFVVQLFSKLEELEQMMARLNTSVNMLPVLAPSDIALGLVCSASSSIDKRWYRAVVISQEDSQVGSGGGITVEFLDYGGRERVLISSIRALPRSFVDLPFQGIHSSLKGVSPSGATWSALACQYFYHRVVSSQIFAIESEREATTSFLFLLDTSMTPNVVINDELVVKQHAIIK